MYRQRMKSSDKQTDLQGDCVLKARPWIEPGRMQMQQGATRRWWFRCSDWRSFVNILVQRSQVFDNLLKCTVRGTQMGLWNSEDWICPRYDHNPDQEFSLRSNCPFRSWSSWNLRMLITTVDEESILPEVTMFIWLLFKTNLSSGWSLGAK